MAQSITKPVALNNSWVNIGDQAVTDGYTGNMIIEEGTILNLNATVAYVHITPTKTQPSTASDGLPIGTTSSTAPNSFFTLPEGTDIRCVYVHTAGNQTIKYSITGK